MSSYHSPPRRRHRQPVTEHADFGRLIVPPPDEDPIVVAEFPVAAQLAMEAVSSGACSRECLVLLDERRIVVAMLCDAPPEVSLLVGQLHIPDVRPACQVIDVVYRETIDAGPPSDDDRRCFEALRRALAVQGVLLLDVILANPNMLRSMSIGCDREPIWFEAFEPSPSGDGRHTGQDNLPARRRRPEAGAA